MSTDPQVLLKMLADLGPDEKEALLRNMAACSAKPATAFGQDWDKTVEVLRANYERYGAKETFRPGQLVVWKNGLKNRKRPVEGEPGIVIEVLEQPVFDSEQGDAGSPYFRESLDIRIGVLDEDEEFLIFHYDSRRFTLFKETK